MNCKWETEAEEAASAGGKANSKMIALIMFATNDLMVLSAWTFSG